MYFFCVKRQAKNDFLKDVENTVNSFPTDRPVSILHKSIAGRCRPVRVADGPITARCRFIKNASWALQCLDVCGFIYGVFFFFFFCFFFVCFLSLFVPHLSFFAVWGGLCFVIVAFPGYLHLYFYTVMSFLSC